GEVAGSRQKLEELHNRIAAGETELTADTAALDDLRRELVAAEDVLAGLRARSDELDASIKDARGVHDEARGVVSALDVARATAEADLSHLAHTCEDAVNAAIDQVVVEVEQMEAEGSATPDATVINAEEPEESEDDDRGVRVQAGQQPAATDSLAEAEQRTLSAEEAIAALRGKIERL